MNSRKTFNLIFKLTIGTVIFTVGASKAQALSDRATSDTTLYSYSHEKATASNLNPLKVASDLSLSSEKENSTKSLTAQTTSSTQSGTLPQPENTEANTLPSSEEASATPLENNSSEKEETSEKSSSSGAEMDTESELESEPETGGLNINFNFSGSPLESGSGVMEEPIVPSESSIPSTETLDPNNTSPRNRSHNKQGLRKQIRKELRREHRQKMRHRQMRKPLWRPSGAINQPARGSSPNNKINQDIHDRINRNPHRQRSQRMHLQPHRKQHTIFKSHSSRFRMRQPGGSRMNSHRPFRLRQRHR